MTNFAINEIPQKTSLIRGDCFEVFKKLRILYFMGAGSTGLAAIKLVIDILKELNEKY